MGLYRQQVLPRLVEYACGGSIMQGWRSKTTAGLSGRILEVGFGSGMNIPAYPKEVTEVLAVEPSLVARRRSEQRVASSPIVVTHIGLNGESLDLPDDTCDGAVSTFTLCTIPDVDTALSEIYRTLKPGSPLHVLEHGISPDADVAKWQHRLDPWQQRFADGCHLTRDAIELLENAGFEVVESASRYAKGPKPWSYFTVAKAMKPFDS